MSVPALNVRWHDGRLVGRIVSPGETYFAYDREWVLGGHNLSPLGVPFTTDTFRQRAKDFDDLPGFLADCIPDQWGRILMQRDFSEHALAPTPIRMLAWVGRRGLGALHFEPVLDGSASVGSWEAATPSLLVREAEAVLRADRPAAFAHLRRGGTAGGALPKATVALLPDGSMLVGGDVAADAALQPHARLGLLKLDHHGSDPSRVTDGRLEHAYMNMARAAGIRVSTTEILHDDSNGEPRHHLFVERFDVLPGSKSRLHVVTLAGLLHRYQLDYRDLLLTTRQLTQDHAEVLEATRRMIFNVRAANHDDHGKNHSFVFDERTRRWTLSPAYDVTLNAGEAHTYAGLSHSSFGRSPRLDSLRLVAMDAGVSIAEFTMLNGEVEAALGRWAEFAAVAEVPDLMAERAASIHQAVAELLKATVSPRPGKPPRRKLWE